MAIRVVEFSNGGTKLERFLPKNQHTPACFVESVHFFLVILVILLTAEPVRILKMEVPQVSNFEFFTAEPLKFHYC